MSSQVHTTGNNAILSLDRHGFIIPKFPTSCPPIHNQTDILSISVGNSHYSWSLHTSYENEFLPLTTWRTTPLSENDVDDSVLMNNNRDHFQGSRTTSTAAISNNVKKLVDYLPAEVLDRLFGTAQPASSSSNNTAEGGSNGGGSSGSSFTVSSARQYRLTQKRIPYIYIYIVSTNLDYAAPILSLFHTLPCIFYRLSSTDFLLPNDPSDASLTTTALYDGIGVDRVANVMGAQVVFPRASKQVLVIDGGTALTYTTNVPVPDNGTSIRTTANNSSSTNTTKYIYKMGGGISPGLQMRFRALFDYSLDVPFVKSSVFMDVLKECTRLRQPLHLFAVPQVSGDAITNIDSDNNMCKSIIACVMTEMAFLLCNTIRKWLDMLPPKDTTQPLDPEDVPIVVLTGGDSETYERLLQRNHSYICETNDANVELLNWSLHENGDDTHPIMRPPTTGPNGNVKYTPFRVKIDKRLQHHAIANTLLSHINSVRNNMDAANKIEVELVRDQLIGLRVTMLDISDSSTASNRANASSTTSKYKTGTVVSIIRSSSLPQLLDNDTYVVIIDGGKETLALNVRGLYDALLLFIESPVRLRDEKGKIGMLNRKKDAEEAIATLQKESPTIQTHLQSQKPIATTIENAATAIATPEQSVVENFEVIIASGKRKPALASTGGANKKLSVDPRSYVGRRVAKYFEVEGHDGNMFMKLFFGTVTEYVKKYEWWHVVYEEDDDSEDMTVVEFKKQLALYDEKKAEDPNPALGSNYT